MVSRSSVPPGAPGVSRLAGRLVCSACGARGQQVRIRLLSAGWDPVARRWLGVGGLRCFGCGRRRLAALRAFPDQDTWTIHNYIPKEDKMNLADEIRNQDLSIEAFDDFCKSHHWTYFLDGPTAQAFGRRWARAWHMYPHAVSGPVGDGRDYIVYSATHEDHFYRAHLDRGCDCPDVARAPWGWCKHLLAAWIYVREWNKELQQEWEEEMEFLDHQIAELEQMADDARRDGENLEGVLNDREAERLRAARRFKAHETLPLLQTDSANQHAST